MKTVDHLRFDHVSGADPGHALLARLEAAGLRGDTLVTRHPGEAVCRFVRFGPQLRRRAYLELIDFEQGTPPGHRCGLALAPVGRPLARWATTAPRIAPLGPALVHRNYDWPEGGADRRPGWNFLMFGASPPRLLVWLIEYESAREVARPRTAAARLVEVQLDVDAKGRRFFAQLLGVPPGWGVTLACGTVLRFRRALRTRLIAVRLIGPARARGTHAGPGFDVVVSSVTSARARSRTG